MKLIIKNPAPNDHRMKKWGDYHFGRSLSKYLTRSGIEVVTHYKSQWGKIEKGDAVLVLRGKYPYHPDSATKNIVWVYSHPASITGRELEPYDAVCVASEYHAVELKKTVNKPIFSLLQCTDPEEFNLSARNQERAGAIFVGNTRNIPRPCVQWAIEYGLDLRVWGRGWDEFIDTKYVMGGYISNEELGGLYQRSRFTINDHWNDMAAFGYINNRVFDALACGLPVISDHHDSLQEKFPDEILYYKNRDDFFRSLDTMQRDYDLMAEKTSSANRTVIDEFSFEKRAAQLIELINSIAKKTVSRPSVSARFADRMFRRDKSSDKSPATIKLLEKKFSHREKERFCPICFSYIDAFIHIENEQYDMLQCPVCASLERHRNFWVYFSNKIIPLIERRTISLLHLAPEKQVMHKLEPLDNVVYTSADPSSPLAMVKIDPGNTYFPDEKFDIVLFSVLPENMRDFHVLLPEIHRIVKKEGMAVFQVPASAADDPAEFEEQYRAQISDAGFSVTQVNITDDLPDDLVRFLGLRDYIICECVKP